MRGKSVLHPAAHSSGKYSKYVYCLFVSGKTRHAQTYIEAVRAVCDRHIGDGYNFDIVDVLEDPERAESEQIYVTPTLIRYQPPPSRRIVGDFSSEVVLAARLGFFK